MKKVIKKDDDDDGDGDDNDSKLNYNAIKNSTST